MNYTRKLWDIENISYIFNGQVIWQFGNTIDIQKLQPKTAREENRYPVFVASEQGLDASALSEHLNRSD